MFTEAGPPLLAVAVRSAALLAGAPAAVAADEEPNVHVVSTRFDKLGYQPGDAATVTYGFPNWGSVEVVNDSGGSGDPRELEVTDQVGVSYGREGPPFQWAGGRPCSG